MSKLYTWADGISDAMRVRELGVVAVALQGKKRVVLEIPKDDPRAEAVGAAVRRVVNGEALVSESDTLAITLEEAEVIQCLLKAGVARMQAEAVKLGESKQANQFRKNLGKLEAIYHALGQRMQAHFNPSNPSAKGDVR